MSPISIAILIMILPGAISYPILRGADEDSTRYNVGMTFFLIGLALKLLAFFAVFVYGAWAITQVTG